MQPNNGAHYTSFAMLTWALFVWRPNIGASYTLFERALMSLKNSWMKWPPLLSSLCEGWWLDGEIQRREVGRLKHGGTAVSQHTLFSSFFFFRQVITLCSHWQVKLYIIHYIENPAGLRSKEKCSYALPVKDGGMWDSVSLLVNPLKGVW